MLFIVLVCLLPFVTSKIPDGFILDVSVACGDGTTTADITVTSDMAVRIEVDCAGTDTSAEISGVETAETITVNYGTASSGSCYFKNPDDDSGLSFVVLHMYYGPGIDSVQNQKESYKVTCLSKPSKMDSAAANTGFVSFAENGIVDVVSGAGLTDTITFKLVDVLDQALDSATIPIGKKVQLKAVLTSGGTATSIQTSDCLAIGNDNSAVTYSILRAGCGDGAIFATNVGFDTSALEVRSPFFPFFSLEGQSGLSFSCNFTTCTAACDGSSCVTRKKRSVHIITDESTSAKSESAKEQKSMQTSVKGESPASSWMTVFSRPYVVLDLKDAKMKQREVGHTDYPVGEQRHLKIAVSVLGTLTLISTLMSLYMCFKWNTPAKREIRCECIKP